MTSCEAAAGLFTLPVLFLLPTPRAADEPVDTTANAENHLRLKPHQPRFFF